ncbi:MAG: hypothetical protein QOI45_2449 [Thermoleophilaceae bacterium]|jgi:hypothetical protein|nr:hypothetical protein [Thermoleophilaceae bacterium]MEA2456187.1 hypothetical protein [Thermoleophilaceae bacterium]
MGTTLIRGGLLLLAVLAGAWLVVSFQNARLETDAEAVALHAQRVRVSPAEVQRARAGLKDARRLSADQAPRLTEGGLLLATGHRAQAAAIARQVAATEPDNVEARFLAFASARDRAEALRAKREVTRLNPWAGEQLRP